MSSGQHIVFLPASAKSHVRLLFQFSLNLLTIHPSLSNTFLVSSINAPFLNQEAALQPASLMNALKGRWQIVEVEVGLQPETSALIEREAFKDNLHIPLKKMMEGKGSSGFTQRPSAFVIDVRW